MKENGLELSGEKTCFILFDNGENPHLELDGQILNYKQNTVSGGIPNYQVELEFTY